jgi:hypothetical protein
MSDHPSNQNLTQINLDKDFVEKSTCYKNIGQEIIITTSKNIKLCLLQNKEVLRSKVSWITPLGILIALLAALVTADFNKKFLGIKPEIWETLFIMSSIVCFIWLMRDLWRGYKNKDKGDIDHVIQELKEAPESDFAKKTGTNILK